MIHGIDISNNQGPIDWSQVPNASPEITFAFAKATESTTYHDPYFPDNWAAIKDLGLVRGAYHFAQPDRSSPEDQAAYFLNYVGDLEPGDLLALDIEAGTGNLIDWVWWFMHQIESAVGFKPILYSGLWFLKPHSLLTTQATVLSDMGLWLASYGLSVPPTPPAPWDTLALWQYTDELVVPGISTPVDGDYFLGTRDELLLYGMPTPSIPDPTPDPCGDSST